MRMPHAARHATHAARRRDGEHGGGDDGRRGWRANAGDAHAPGSGWAGDGWAAERVGAADLSKQGCALACRAHIDQAEPGQQSASGRADSRRERRARRLGRRRWPRGGSAGGGGRGLHAIGRHARKARACEGRLRGWTVRAAAPVTRVRACGGSAAARVRACGSWAAARVGAHVWRACVSCAAEKLSTGGSAGRGRARTTGGPRRGQGEGGRVRTVGGGGEGGEW